MKLIAGGARGVDTLAAPWAEDRGISASAWLLINLLGATGGKLEGRALHPQSTAHVRVDRRRLRSGTTDDREVARVYAGSDHGTVRASCG